MTQQIQPDTCQQAIIRIFSENGDYYGTGVLSVAGLIVTCAHVVRQALELEEGTTRPPVLDGRVKVDFPFLNQTQKYEVELATGGWGPEDGWALENDIAILKLKETPPFEVGYLFNSDKSNHDLDCSIYGFTRSSLQGSEVSGTLKPTVNPVGLQVLDTDDSAFAADNGFSGGAFFPREITNGTPQAQGILIGNKDNHPLLKDGQKQRIVYVIPASRINKLLLKVIRKQGDTGQNNDLANASTLIRAARTGVNRLAQKNNDARQFVAGINDWLDELEELTKETEELSVDELECLVRFLYRYQQEARESGYDQYLSLMPFGDLCPKLNDFVQKLDGNRTESEESLLVENNLIECSDEYLDEIRALQREIKSRLSMLRSHDIQLEKEKKDRAKAALQNLLQETHQKRMDLIVINRIRQTLQELDKTVFDELIMFSQLLLGKYANSLKPGMVFRDTKYSPEMVMVPAENFMMGSPEDEDERHDDEGPQHKVTIPKALAVAVYTVTLADFEKFINETGYYIPVGARVFEGGGWVDKDDKSWRNPGFDQSSDHPVVCINWDDAMAYIKWLNKKAGKQYRLLSEAEWEYCCRAGTETRYWWGDEITEDQANYNSNNSKTASVDSYEPNPWGLYQMHGNVNEWCQDEWHESYDGAPVDGSAWISSSANEVGGRVLRGGSWSNFPRVLRSAYRNYYLQPTFRFDNVGFRISRTSFTS